MTLLDRAMGRVASGCIVKPAIRLDDGPMCSFTFDDCPANALHFAGTAIESVGGTATFFLSGGARDEDFAYSSSRMHATEIVSALDRGHEIGCHTFTHASLRKLSRSEMVAEFDHNLDALRRSAPEVALASFAYPFGEVSFDAKREVAARFPVARGVRPGFNGRLIDLAELRAFELASDRFDERRIDWIVAQTVRRRCWTVFFGHDVDEAPSRWGCTPRQFDYVLRSVSRAGIPILNLRAALGRAMHRVGGEIPAEGTRSQP